METITSGIKSLLGIGPSDGKITVDNTNPIAALLGQTGVGKTQIYNKLCNTQHATKYNRGSLTYEIR